MGSKLRLVWMPPADTEQKARRLHHLFYHSKVFEALKLSQSAPNWTDKHSSFFFSFNWISECNNCSFSCSFGLLKWKYFSGERDPIIISVLHFCCGTFYKYHTQTKMYGGTCDGMCTDMLSCWVIIALLIFTALYGTQCHILFCIF